MGAYRDRAFKREECEEYATNKYYRNLWLQCNIICSR